MMKIAVSITSTSTTLTVHEDKLFLERINLDKLMIKSCNKVFDTCKEPIIKDFFICCCRHEFCAKCFKENDDFLNCKYKCKHSLNRPFLHLSNHQKIKAISFIEKDPNTKFYKCMLCDLSLKQDIV